MIRLLIFLLSIALIFPSCAFRKSCGMSKKKLNTINNGNYNKTKKAKKLKKKSRGKCVKW